MAISIEIVWTEYMRHRANLRGFDLAQVEHILRHSSERYIDVVTGRLVAIGWHGKMLVMIPYDSDDKTIIPVTIHTTTRQQVNLRIKNGRFSYE